MSGEIGELEALSVLIGMQHRHEDEEERKWPIMALLSVVEILMDYYAILDGDDEESRNDLEARAVESIHEQIHNWIVHNGIPMTEEERIALEDQEVAEFTHALSKISGMKIMDFDNLLEKKKEDEEDKNGNE